jgi:hypothetical protein
MATTTKKKIKTSHVFMALAAITCVLVAVMGWHWTDTANTPFWADFWNVAAVVCLVVWVVAWAYFWNREKHSRV